MLKVKDLSFAYGDKKIIHNLSVNIQMGSIATLIGASGSGKTTLFKLLTNIIRPSDGSIEILRNQQASYMTQQDLLLPWRTVLENVVLPHELGRAQAVDINKAKSLIREVQLTDCENRYPTELSGGMRQRVSLARALMLDRPLLLLDEPFASLDVSLREQMYDLLRSIQERRGTTILMITHDFRDAVSLSNHIYHLGNGSIEHEWHISEEQRNDPVAMTMLTEELRCAIKRKGLEKNKDGKMLHPPL